MKKSKRTIYDCDRCRFTYKKKDLRRQRGMLLCEPCFDTVLEIEPINLRVRSPRDNSTTVSAVTSPTVFTVTTAGITALSKSQNFEREGTTNSFVMHVKGLPTTVTANPQIVSGVQGTYLTLVGTDDVNYVTLKAGNGTDMLTDFQLKKGRVLSLVYNASSSKWTETSRYTGGLYG